MSKRFLLGLLLLGLCAGRILRAEAIRLEADLREAPRGLIHAKLRIPVRPGPLTLFYPRWIPGEHSPSGPVADVAGLIFTAGGRPVPWHRDLENMYALHLEVPAGAAQLDIRLDYLSPTAENAGYSAGPCTSAQLAVLNWNLIALYPAGIAADQIQVKAAVILPSGWQCGTSLPVESTVDRRVDFRPVTLEMLIDQPVIAGAHFRRFDLIPGASTPHVIDCAADSEAALALSPARLAAYRRVPLEYAKLMGVRYYREYHFLLSLSDFTGYNGLEHHQCSDNRAPERAWIDDDIFVDFASLLTHEYFHSWNGKHRRPADLLSPDYQVPMRTDLLWVYEGLTEYYGDVLAVRAGLWSANEYEEHLAQVAARVGNQKGRDWRPLQDTADAAQNLYAAARGWSARRRSVDFYAEGELIWLEADALIRARSRGTASLDDFVRRFFGDGSRQSIEARTVPSESPSVETYTAEQVYAALNAVLPHDWKEFFTTRLTRTGPGLPFAGLLLSGRRLIFSGVLNRFLESSEKTDKRVDLRFSLGFVMDEEAQTIGDVIPGSPADQAGLGPNMKVIAVNGRKYSNNAMRDALLATPGGGPLELLIENADYITPHRLTYTGGLRYPHLAREETSDILAEIIAPRVPVK